MGNHIQTTDNLFSNIGGKINRNSTRSITSDRINYTMAFPSD
ncbi:hypothetical protein [Brassicibacter mesophilus]